MIRINNIKLSIDENINMVIERASKLAKIDKNAMRNFRILKEAVDARKKNNIFLVYNVQFQCENEAKIVKRVNNKDVILDEYTSIDSFQIGSKKLEYRPIVVGSGPAGLFAGLVLSKNGYKPIIFERGGSVDERSQKIKTFWEKGKLDTESNIQFGEGGAGTFSDGKLTTRIRDIRCDYVIDEFIKAGAPHEIAYSWKPHIGTDILKDVVKNIRNKIIDLGGEVRFNSKITDVEIKDGRCVKLRVNNEYDIPCSAAIFALGHSARDTYEMLFSKGVKFEQKPFAIGVRIEHLQSMIDESQYGVMAKHPKLRAANYRLAYTSKIDNRTCYSFCMCPGGIVVGASSENERLVTNGMSEYKRDKANANSAIVVGVGPRDFKSTHPLAGIEFQRNYENLAFIAGGRNYMAPVQLAGDFLKDEISKKIGEIEPSYTNGYVFADLRDCLPNYITDTIKEGILDFDKKIKGFARYDAVITGNETRTSSPVRIIRDESLESVAVKGIFPAGEGAGYAGGIMSAAVDGIKVAERIMQTYKCY